MATESLGAIAQVMQELGKLPGIGPKSAERITHYLLGAGNAEVIALADALRNVAEKVRPCRQCYNLTENELCNICTDVRRDQTTICVVELARDVMTLERVGTFRGLYHVLQGRLAPLDEIGPEKLTIDALLHRVARGGVKEIIMATNPTLEGDGTALYISNLLAESGVRVTRLARGVATGSVLEFANTQMLADALEGRQAF
jgi:recombination protein RecR